MIKIITVGELKTGAFGLGRRIDVFLDLKEIGYWFCESALRDEYGVFHPNEHLKEMLGDKAYTGGDLGNVLRVLSERLNQ